MTERRPSSTSGWRRDRRAERAVLQHVNGDTYSVWRRRGVFVISALTSAELPDGSGETGSQWHVSMSRWAAGVATRASDEECRQTLACLGLAGAEEDNHEPGIARHFWVPVDPARRRDCECKETERVVVEPDGHRWSTPLDEAQCHGCDYAAMVKRISKIDRPCPIHGAAT